MNRAFKHIAACVAAVSMAAGLTGCKQLGEQTASAWETVSDTWKEFTGKNGQKKNEDQVTLASLQKSAEDQLASVGSSIRDGAVSVVKDGTKQAIEEATETSQDAVQTVARSTQVTGSNMTEKAVSMERAARSYVYYYMPDNIPRSEKEAREIMFSSGIFSGMGDWFRRVFSGNGNQARRLIRQTNAVHSGSASGPSRSSGNHGSRRLDGRRRPS